MSETGYSGAFTFDMSKCANIATTSVTQGNGPSATFALAAGSSGGTCTATITDAAGQSGNVNITVTITQGIIQ